MPIRNFATDIRAVPQFGIDANAVRIIRVPLDNAREDERLDIIGTFLYAISSSSKNATLNVAFQEQVQDGIPYKEGQFISGLSFSQVYFTNDAQAGEFLLLMYGVEEAQGLTVQNPSSQYNNISVIKPTTVSTVADVAIAAGATQLISAADATRKEILISNFGTNANVIRVGDVNTGAARGIEVGIGQTVNLTVTGAIYAYCVGAQSVGVTLIKD